MKTVTALILLLIATAGCNLGHHSFRTITFEEEIGECIPYFDEGQNGKDLNEEQISKIQQSALVQDICAKNNLLSFATIEFKDNGTFWNRDQLRNVEKEIMRISQRQLLEPNERGRAILLVLYIHGWRHNASEASSDLRNFRSFAHDLAKSDVVCYVNEGIDSCPPSQKPHVLAVYLGWRGDSTGITSRAFPQPLKKLLGVSQLATFWHRKQAARNVAGVAMTEAILNILSCVDAADLSRRKAAGASQSEAAQRTTEGANSPCTFEGKSPVKILGKAEDRNERVFQKSRKVLIGHSFGARALELAIAQAYLADRARSLQLYRRYFDKDGEKTKELAENRRLIGESEGQKNKITSIIKKYEVAKAALLADRGTLENSKAQELRRLNESKVRRSSAIDMLQHLFDDKAVVAPTTGPCLEYGRTLAEACANKSVQSPRPTERQLISCIAGQIRCLHDTHICTIKDTILRHGESESQTTEDWGCDVDEYMPRQSCENLIAEELATAIGSTPEDVVEDWIDYHCSLSRRATTDLFALDQDMKKENWGRLTTEDEVQNAEVRNAEWYVEKGLALLNSFAGWAQGWLTRISRHSSVSEVDDRLSTQISKGTEHANDTIRKMRGDLMMHREEIKQEEETIASISAVIERHENDIFLHRQKEDALAREIGSLEGLRGQKDAELKELRSKRQEIIDNNWFLMDEYLRPPADLVLLLNAATEAVISLDLLMAMRGYGVAEAIGVHVPPAIVSITSEADWATRGLFRVGNWLGHIARLGPTVKPEDRELEFGTIGHYRDKQTHSVDIGEVPMDSDLPRFLIGCDEYVVEEDGAKGRETSGGAGEVGSMNYWVVKVSSEVIPNHGDIFLDKKGRGRCVDNDGVRKPLLGIVLGLMEKRRLFEPLCVLRDGKCDPRRGDGSRRRRGSE